MTRSVSRPCEAGPRSSSSAFGYGVTAASVGNASDKDLAHDITFVRKAALDAVARAFRDAMNSNEPTARCSRLAVLSELCHRLPTARLLPSVGRPNSETSMLLAKLMLEKKNFTAILTNALADVDLDFPHVDNLINAILRTLENLTKIAIKTTEDSSMLSGDKSDSNDSASDDHGVAGPAIAPTRGCLARRAVPRCRPRSSSKRKKDGQRPYGKDKPLLAYSYRLDSLACV